MKKKKLLLIVVFLISVVVTTYYFYSKNNISIDFKQNSYIIPTVKPQYSETTVLIPVTKFTNLKSSYTLPELQKSQIYSLLTNKEILPNDYTDILLIEESEILTYLQDENIILLTPEQVKPEYKTINVDGQNFWQKEFNLETYSFKKDIIIDGVKPNEIKVKKTQIFASGEIIPARAVDRLGFNKYGNHSYVYDFFKEDMSSADVSISMLENSLLGDPTPCTGCLVFRGDDQAAKGIADAGFDLLSTAGNHAGDAGQKAYANTLELFKNLDIQTTGTGKTDIETLTPAIMEVDGRTIGLLGADDIAYFYWNSRTNDNTYGTNAFSKITNTTVVDYERVEQIADIKTEYDIDYLIIYMSWGIEYRNTATSHQKELGRALVDNGADLVLSAHSHWVQPIEFYKGTPIFYGLGNFIFDQTHTLPTRQGVVVNLYYYGEELKNIELMPTQSCGYHQTWNNVLPNYLSGEYTLEEVYALDETKACVFFQPKKLKEGDDRYNQILERMFEYTEVQ